MEISTPSKLLAGHDTLYLFILFIYLLAQIKIHTIISRK